LPRISYLNGEYLPHEKATVPIEDRGLQFSDAVYEVVSFFNGQPLDLKPHMDRLRNSLEFLSIAAEVKDQQFLEIIERLIARNNISTGIVYIQITRGVAPRDHAIPEGPLTPTVIATTRPLDMEAIRERLQNGVKIIVVKENRWAHPNVKSTSLLGNVLAKEMATKKKAYEAVYLGRDGNLTEGTASNLWIVNNEGVLVTCKTDGKILPGITRLAVVDALSGAVKGIEERPFALTELKTAREVFLTSTTSFVMPVVNVDGEIIGEGRPGPVTKILQKAYWEYIRKQTGFNVE
jgi:D-alanine transaminase